MDAAENTALQHQNDKVNEDYEYYNTKYDNGSSELKFKRMDLAPNSHFYDMEVNTSYSAVHVPTNVYDRAPEVLKAIKWSEQLDSIFMSNYQADPSLSWQYFGSSTGFLRLYPATSWKIRPEDIDVDLYDCRMRSWYIEAAASPKDVVILVDNSGSMTGMRREIARHVVNNILDTLGPNDFVNVYNFSEEIQEVVECFRGGLVQATLANIRELKRGMEDLYTDKIANFSAVLHMAFRLLETYRNRSQGAHCNQAIMLVTDGVPYNYKEIFKEHNWQNLPHMPVRVFTYLIGREVADVREVKWMACANKGYYVHLSTLPEVQEKVLEYIPVMARPLVLGKSEHPIIWTQVYADISDPKSTDWLWNSKQNDEQKHIFQTYRNKSSTVEKLMELQKYIEDLKQVSDDDTDSSDYQLMTSVAIPVYDGRENASKIANLLGVAGTDFPVKDIEAVMMAHLLGVNGYAFLVNNNGHVVIHPDLRPVFQGILKPNYNNVDLTEVELIDDNSSPREFSNDLLAFRDAVIKQKSGNFTFKVKYHFDKMRRAACEQRQYFYKGIENTPFSLVVSLPVPHGLTTYKLEEPSQELRRLWNENEKLMLKIFTGKRWKIHPDWTYCKYHYDTEHFYDTPEEEFSDFFGKTQGKFPWHSKRTVTPPEHCDRDLFTLLVNDAIATSSYYEPIQNDSSKDKFLEKFGFTISFVATQGGLTRWEDWVPPDDSEKHFSEIHNKAIDEIWYKRAVDYHYRDKDVGTFVYSVPFDAGDRNDTLVTATHAIFFSNDGKRAPAAVVGFQARYSAFHAFFSDNILSKCGDLHCYVLDNNGFVIVSRYKEDTGRFFGEVRGIIMQELIDNVYQKITIYDYQAVCLRKKSSANQASCKLTPWDHIVATTDWFLNYVYWFLYEFDFPLLWFGKSVYATEEEEISSSEDGTVIPDGNNMQENNKGSERQLQNWTIIPRTRPQPCDKEVDLYDMNHTIHPWKHTASGDDGCNRQIETHSIPHTNLILVLIDETKCIESINSYRINLTPEEVEYNNVSSLACYKYSALQLSRERPKSCISNHTEEKDIELCGGCSSLECSITLFLVSIVMILHNLGRHK